MGTVAAAALFAVPAQASWPGANGRIAFDTLTERGMEVRTSTLGGKRMRRLVTVPPQPAGLERVSGGAQWSPGGGRLVYEDARYGVRTMRADGRRKRTVTARMIWPTWSPDGRVIVGSARETPPFTLFRVRAHGGGGRRVAAGDTGSVELPRWSPDGRWIAFEGGSNGVGVWVVRPSGRGARRLTDGHAVAWAPGGRRLAYALGPDIFTIRPDGSGRRVLHRGPRDSSVVSMAWAPNGRSILLVRQYPADAHDRSDVDTIPAHGGRERRHFSSDHFIGRIDWQPRHP